MDEYTTPIRQALLAYEAEPSPETLEPVILALRAFGTWFYRHGAQRQGLAVDQALIALQPEASEVGALPPELQPEEVRAALTRAGAVIGVSLTADAGAPL